MTADQAFVALGTDWASVDELEPAFGAAAVEPDW